MFEPPRRKDGIAKKYFDKIFIFIYLNVLEKKNVSQTGITKTNFLFSRSPVNILIHERNYNPEHFS